MNERWLYGVGVRLSSLEDNYMLHERLQRSLVLDFEVMPTWVNKN